MEFEGRSGYGQGDYREVDVTESHQITCPYKSKGIYNVYKGRQL